MSPTRILLLLPLVALAFSCKSGRDERPLPEVNQSLVVGCDLDNPPFAYESSTGPAGRDVAMMRRIAARLRVPVEWRKIPFENLLPMLQLGEVDCVCATMGITPEREEQVLFTRPYFETQIVVVVRTGAGEPQNFAQLEGRRVGVGAGTTSERAVRSMLPHALCVTAGKDEATTEERLIAGELDAAAMDAPNAARMIAESDGKLTRIGTALERERYAIAVSKLRPTLHEKIDFIVGELEESRALLELDDNYGLLD